MHLEDILKKHTKFSKEDIGIIMMEYHKCKEENEDMDETVAQLRAIHQYAVLIGKELNGLRKSLGSPTQPVTNPAYDITPMRDSKEFKLIEVERDAFKQALEALPEYVVKESIDKRIEEVTEQIDQVKTNQLKELRVRDIPLTELNELLKEKGFTIVKL